MSRKQVVASICTPLLIINCLCLTNFDSNYLLPADLVADGTKHPCTPEKIKEKEQAGLVSDEKEKKQGDQGPSVEVKEEGSKDRADVKPSKEKLKAAETAADSKPPGDKYSPKVSLKKNYPLVNVLSYDLPYCRTLTVFGFSSN